MMLNVVSAPKPNKHVRVVGRRGKHKQKTPRQLLEIRLDEISREIVLNRDGYCVCPAPKEGHRGARQSGHLITRGKESIKWDLRNLNEQCASCNGRHEHYPHYYTNWFLREFGAEVYHSLCADGEVVKKMSMEQLRTLCVELEAIKAKQVEDKLFKPRFSQAQILDGSWKEK